MLARNLYQLSLINEDTKEGLWFVADETTLDKAKGRCNRMLQAAHKNGVPSKVDPMTEQQIIARIQTTTDPVEVASQRRMVHLMQHHLKAWRSGKVEGTRGWINSSTLLFSEDFEAAMQNLSAVVRPSEEMLKQLERIEAALSSQLEKIDRRRKK